MTRVARETLGEIETEYALPPAAPDQIARLLEALASEPDPHTTVSDPGRALDVHVRDSFSALEIDSVRSARAIVDIGAGAGFPGLPLAIALADVRVDLVESASRKCVVIERLASAAGIGNARAVQARAEDWARDEGAAAYDVATARAVAPLAVLVEYAAPLLALGGTFVAWKGAVTVDEVGAGDLAAAELGLEPRLALHVVPFEGAQDLALHVYSKVRDTPARFPRRAGMATKRPLAPKKRATPPLT